MSQKPSPCRFVLYCFRDRAVSRPLVERPAVITSVREEGVNLTVFFEEDDSDECSRGHSGALDVDPRRECVPENTDPEPKANTWRWPPRA